MMRRHAIGGFVGGVLMLLLGGGVGADRSWAAEVKAPRPAARMTGAIGEGAVTVPPPAVAPAAPQTTVIAPAAPQTAVVTPAAPQTYSYNPAGKPDPFLPFVETDLAVKKEKEKKAKEEELKKRTLSSKRPISPLQMAEIKQFRLVGIAGDDRARMAIVEDTTIKKFYPLFVGTSIGPNGGRILSIQNDRLIVEEPMPQAEPGKVQKKQTRTITIMLHKEDEGKP
jgi:type IV pilus assembly protein PilP